jgi:hypothetical protein
MGDFIEKVYHASEIIVATGNVLAKIDWTGKYTDSKLSDQDIQYIGKATNVEQYFKRFIETVKDNILKNIKDINSIKWIIKSFDETINLHILVREVGKFLEKYLKLDLIKKYPQFKHHINKQNINYYKTIIIEITNHDKIIFVANLSVESFI